MVVKSGHLIQLIRQKLKLLNCSGEAMFLIQNRKVDFDCKRLTRIAVHCRIVGTKFPLIIQQGCWEICKQASTNIQFKQFAINSFNLQFEFWNSLYSACLANLSQRLFQHQSLSGPLFSFWLNQSVLQHFSIVSTTIWAQYLENAGELHFWVNI